MKIELTADGLRIRDGQVLNLRFPAPLDDLTLRRQKKLLNGFTHRISRHHSQLQFILQPDLFLEQSVARYFVGETTSTTPVRPLFGLIIGLIMARRAPEALGDFAHDLYKLAQDQLTEEGAFRTPVIGKEGVFHSIIIGTFATLEELFAAKIADILPQFEQDWQRKNRLKDADRVFINLTKRVEQDAAAAAPAPRRTEVQTCLPFNNTERLTQLRSNVRGNGGVIRHPAFVKSFAPRDGATTRPKRTATKTTGEGADTREYAGSYIDFTGKPRSIPTLNAQTIKGIALSAARNPEVDPDLFSQSMSSVLSAEIDPRSIDYLYVAQQGSNRRRKDARVGGPNIIAESAEFHVRLFRAIGLTVADAQALSAEELKGLVRLAIGLYALDEKEIAAA